MFKRLLEMLSAQKQNNVPIGQEADTLADDELITVYDPYGCEMRIPRHEWRIKVLEPHLQLIWHDPDKLYTMILSALKEGFIDDLQQASARLLEIDPTAERSYALHSHVLIKLGNLSEAEVMLQAAMVKIGETGTLLTSLAKVYLEQGKKEQVGKVLWKAVQKDPNQESGLLWWANLHKEYKGEAGFLDALNMAAKVPGSWLPQLWLARHWLEMGNIAAAELIYKAFFTHVSYPSEAVLMIAGDLHKYGQYALMQTVVGRLFDPKHHDIQIGIHLLQAYLALGVWQEGEHLLNQLYILNRPSFKQRLDFFRAEYQKFHSGSVPVSVQVENGHTEFKTILLDKPIWTYGLKNPEWIFSKKESNNTVVAYLPFAMCGKETLQEGVSQHEGAVSQLTRAIPLYLAEATHYWTDHTAHTYITVVQDGGPVVFGRESSPQEACRQFRGKVSHLVTGNIYHAGAQAKVSLQLWDCSTGLCTYQQEMETTLENIGHVVLKLEDHLLARFKRRARPLDAFYSRPSAGVIGSYLIELGQLLELTLVANKYVPKESLWGERDILEWPLRMARHWRSSEVAKLMFLSSIGKAAAYKSDILLEFKERSLLLMSEASSSDSIMARFEPFVWKAFGLSDKLKEYHRQLGKDVDPSYRAWVERIAPLNEMAETR